MLCGRGLGVVFVGVCLCFKHSSWLGMQPSLTQCEEELLAFDPLMSSGVKYDSDELPMAPTPDDAKVTVTLTDCKCHYSYSFLLLPPKVLSYRQQRLNLVNVCMRHFSA